MRMSPNMAAVTHIHVEFDHKLHSLQHMQTGMLRMAAQATITARFLLICPIHNYLTQLSKSYIYRTSSSYVKRASQTHTSSHNHTTPQPISIPPLSPQHGSFTYTTHVDSLNVFTLAFDLSPVVINSLKAFGKSLGSRPLLVGEGSFSVRI